MSPSKFAKLSCLVFIVPACFAITTPVYAHGFGERYDLPIPLEMYFLGAVATVGTSFLVIVLITQKGLIAKYPRKNIAEWRLANFFLSHGFLALFKILSLAIFFLILAAGFIGVSDSNQNILPTFIWVIFWVGMVFISGFVGNMWKLLNPWLIMYEVVENSYRFFFTKGLTRYSNYPQALGAYPAVILFLLFAWIENIWVYATEPFALSLIISAYSVFTLAGMFYFGPKIWLQNCEIFSLVMQFFARLAFLDSDKNEPYQYRSGSVNYQSTQTPLLNIRLFGSGLVKKQKTTLAEGILLIVILSTVSFDGFAETDLWSKFIAFSYGSFSWLGVHTFSGIKTFGLLSAPIILGTAFVLAIWCGKKIAHTQTPLPLLVAELSISLMPIAFAYHVAHYFSYLFIQGQRVIALISDPFGWGWDVIGTATYTPDISLIDAEFAWGFGLSAIVIGHVLAIYSAHVIASRTFYSLSGILKSQIPLMLLMIVYTVLSLWILSQPIVSH